MIRLLATLSLCFAWTGALAAAWTVPDEIIVRYRSDERRVNHGRVVRRPSPQLEVLRLEDGAAALPAAERAEQLGQRLRQVRGDANVLYAEANFLGHFEQSLADTPNDPAYASQWWLPAVGDRAMWALGRGADIVVAVIDTGVDLTHPDLSANLLPNGYNFGDGNNLAQDLLGHGTRVAGIIAAARNNALGISGLAPEAKILPLKINVGAQSSFSSDQLARAIVYATSQGARIINLSLTVEQHTQTVQDAIQAALDAGILVVAAAGNSGGAVEFPASMAGVIAVAASDPTGRLATLSNSGPEIAIAAPGIGIISTALGGGVTAANGDGTSYAAPIVSAAIADMLSINASVAPAVILSQLRASATPLVAASYGIGCVNAGQAGNSLVPHLFLDKPQFSAAESLSLRYAMPPTGGGVDVYVAVDSPVGIYSLGADGRWSRVVGDAYWPLASAYRSSESSSGSLFGDAGLFPPIVLQQLPAGAYTWAVALRHSDSGKLIGAASLTPMLLR